MKRDIYISQKAILISNGGFETASTGENNDVFANWTETVTTTNAIAVAGYSGSYAAQVDAGNSVEQIVKVEPGQTYELTGYINMAGVRAYVKLYEGTDENNINETALQLHFDLRDGKSCTTGLTFEDGSVTKPTKGSWCKFSYQITAGETTNYLKVELVGKSGLTGFDDIAIHKVTVTD